MGAPDHHVDDSSIAEVEGLPCPRSGSERSRSRLITGLTRILARISANSSSTAALVLVAVVLPILYFGTAAVMAFGDLYTMVYAKHFADPSFVPGSWEMNLPRLPRLPFDLLIYPNIPSTQAPTVGLMRGA